MAITYVQALQQGFDNDNTVVSFDVTPVANMTSGNSAIAVVANEDAMPVSMADSLGGTWTRIHTAAIGSGSDHIAWFLRSAASTPLTTSSTVTITKAAIGNRPTTYFIDEFSPLDVFDVGANNSGTGTSMATGTTAATAQADSLAVAAWTMDDFVTFTLDGAYTTLGQEDSTGATSNHRINAAYQILTATGTQTATSTRAAGFIGWTAGIAVIKGAAGGPAPTYPSTAPDFARAAFPFLVGADWRMEGRGRPSSPRESGGPAPMGGFERFIFPRLHPDYTVAGPATHFGASSATITFTGTTSAYKQTFGASTGTLTFTGTTNAVRKAFATSSGTIVFTGTSNAVRKALGASTGRITFTATTANKRSTYGVSTGRITFTGTTAAYKRTFSASTGTIVFGATSNAIIAGGAVTHFGASVGRITFTATTGQRLTAVTNSAGRVTFTGTTGTARLKTVASSAGRLTFTATTGQRLKSLANSQGRVTFTGTTIAYKRLFGVSTGRVTFTATSNALNLGTPPATVPATLTITEVGTATVTLQNLAGATATVVDNPGAAVAVTDSTGAHVTVTEPAGADVRIIELVP